MFILRTCESGLMVTTLCLWGRERVGCATILQALRPHEDLNLSIELPLRLHRNLAAQPVRRDSPINLSEIESSLRRSLVFVREQLG
jgi:hypothetical protein